MNAQLLTYCLVATFEIFCLMFSVILKSDATEADRRSSDQRNSTNTLLLDVERTFLNIYL
jgi:hypothetical protein